jgi:nucleotide-binding universal stress UspA family protein
MKPRIFVPFDFGASAERALAWAVDLQRTSGADAIRIVHAINSRPPGTGDVSLDILLPDEGEIAVLEKKMLDSAQEYGGKAVAKVVARANTVGDIILDEAQTADSELIVMGTHGRTGVKWIVFGSVAEHVVRHAPCPVVTVRA